VAKSRITPQPQIDNGQCVHQAADPVERPAAPDPFDPDRLRIGPDDVEALGLTKKLLTIPVRKPGKAEFVRTHPNTAYTLNTAMIEMKDDRECYLIAPDLRPALAAESTVAIKLLHTAVTRQGVLFLWPTKLPGPDGRIDDWSRSALEAAIIARDRWVRVQANLALGAYEVFEATGDLPAPKWPDISLAEILRIAFKDKHITELDHPVLRRLRGEV
jgi:hypothetical protein